MIRYLLFLFFCISIQAQETILLEGKVLNDTIEKSSLTIVNLTMRKGSITNSNGEFRIPVRVNDTINISAVQYESRQFVVNEAIYKRKKILLYLIPKITELEEVKISNIELNGDILKDVKSTDLQPVITSETLGLPQNAHPTFTSEERRLYSATSGGGTLGALINAISGRTKMLKKHLEVSRLQQKVNLMRNKFSDSLYIKEFNIPEKLIEDFVYYVYEDEASLNKIDQENLFELLNFMLVKSKIYLALKKQENVEIKGKRDE